MTMARSWSSDAESIRVAGRYIMDLGDGMSVQISAMWEDLEYEFNVVVTSVADSAMSAFWVRQRFNWTGNLARLLTETDEEQGEKDPWS